MTPTCLRLTILGAVLAATPVSVSYVQAEPRAPDHAQIVFASDRDGNEDIFVMDLDGTNVRNLTNDPSWDSDPTWAPDGRRIAFVSNREGKRDIYVMDSNGRNVVNITNDPENSDYQPTWSPSGNRIAFTS